MGNLTSGRAATEIASLINSRASSPHVTEIETIIARGLDVSITSALQADPLLAEYLDAYANELRHTVAADVIPRNPTLTAAAEAAARITHDVLDRIWQRPAASLSDLALLALIYGNRADTFENGRWVYVDPAETAKDGMPPYCSGRALAFLMTAIWRIARLDLVDRDWNDLVELAAR